MSNLAARFLAASPADARAALTAESELESCLARVVATGRAAWPSLPLEDAVLMAYLARLPGARSLEGLTRLPAADLFLACACARGQSVAIEALETHHEPILRRAGQRAGSLGVAADEFRQLLRTHLFVPVGARPALIETYVGAGPLAAWLRVVAARTAVDVFLEARQRAGIENHDDDAWSEAVSETNLELGALRSQLRGPFRKAMSEGLEALRPEQRSVLRQYFVHHLGIDALAKLMGVHKSNASRTLAKARGDLLAHVRRSLTRQLQLVGTDLDSLIRVIRSDVALSITLDSQS